MQIRWLSALIGSTILAVVLAFLLPAHSGSAGSLDQEAEHEQTIKIGVTTCGVETRASVTETSSPKIFFTSQRHASG
jgi:hypothetical protein